MELKQLRPVSGFEAIVPVKSIVHGSFGLRILLVLWIRVRAHAVEWHLGDGKRQGLVKVHVFYETIGVEKVVALPVWRKYRQSHIAELCVNFFAAAEDDELVVFCLQQRGDGAIVSVVAALPLEGTDGADRLIVVGQIAGRLALYLLWVSAEGKSCVRERQFGLPYALRRGCLIVHQDLVPVNLEVRPDADACGVGGELFGFSDPNRSREPRGGEPVFRYRLS